MNKLEVVEQARRGQSPEYWRIVMRSLSRLEAKVVLIIADRQPITVKAIARYSFASQQTTGSILVNLKAIGLVKSEKGRDKRESYYSLTDAPLLELLRLRYSTGAIAFNQHYN